MKFLFGCLFSAAVACLFNSSYAQVTATAIEGKVVTEDHLPAEASTIILLKYKDSSIVMSAITDKNGEFHFLHISPDTYLILVSAVGYTKSYTGPYAANAGRPLKIAAITLKSSSRQLREVSVVAARPEIEASPGKITLNVQNSILATGNSAYDILRQSPGVRVDNNNGISIVGRQSALITIDGKQTNLTGDDLVSLLRGMPSNMIEKIELITGGSAKYDASGGGIINIVLKKGQNKGENGTVTAGAGYGRYYKGNASLVFNDRTDRFNVFGSYSYSANKTFHDFVTDRLVNFNNVVSNYDVNYNSVQKDYSNTFSLGADYFLSPKHTIGFLVNGSITDDNYVKDNQLMVATQSVPDSTILAHSNLNRHISRVNYNLNYTGKLAKKGEVLSADLNYTTYNRSSAEFITNDFFDATGNPTHSLLLQNLSPSNIHIWLSKIDFTDPLSKTSKIEAGAKFSDVTSNNDLIFGPFVNGAYQSDPRFSNHFVYTEMVNAAYVNYQEKLAKFDLTASLRAEQTIAKGTSASLGRVVNSNYTDVFPTVALAYKASSKNDFSLSYNRGIKRPAYEDLNPFLYYVDVYDFGSGNPKLKPEYTNSVELSYSYNKTFVATLYTTIVSNAYEFKFYEQNDTTSVNLNIPTNLGTIYNYGVRFFAPVVFTSWWNGNFGLDASYQRYVSYPANGNLNKGTQDIIFSTSQYFAISRTLSAVIDGKYESPAFYGISQFKAAYGVNAGISKQLFNRRGSLKLSAADIFNTVRDRYTINYQNLNLSSTDKKESQIFRLTFTYRFGKAIARPPSTHNTGNEDEQTRTKSTVSN